MAEQASKGGTYRPLATRKDAQDYMEDRLNIFNGKYYAVAYGRAPGIYDYWEHILEKIHPYNATHPYLVMAFTSVQAAWEWINETREGHPIPSNFSSAYGYSPHPPSGTDTLSSSMQRDRPGVTLGRRVIFQASLRSLSRNVNHLRQLLPRETDRQRTTTISRLKSTK
jgi:hypothetical protein